MAESNGPDEAPTDAAAAPDAAVPTDGTAPADDDVVQEEEEPVHIPKPMPKFTRFQERKRKRPKVRMDRIVRTMQDPHAAGPLPQRYTLAPPLSDGEPTFMFLGVLRKKSIGSDGFCELCHNREGKKCTFCLELQLTNQPF